MSENVHRRPAPLCANAVRVRHAFNALHSGTEAAHGGDRRSKEFQADIVSLKTEYGNSETYTLRRLRRDREDLAERVESGELSAHSAAIQAGFRPRTFTVRADDPASIAKTLRRQLDPEVLSQLIKELKGESDAR